MNRFSLASIKNVLICEDHSFIQLGIKVALSELLPNLESLETASSGPEAIQRALIQKPDLLIMDLGLPELSGVEVIKELRPTLSDSKILVVTSCDHPATLREVENLGVHAIIQKAASEMQLRIALEHLEAPVATIYLDNLTMAILEEKSVVEFTARELEVLELIVKGQSNQEIADKFGCALTTIRFHRANIMSKAGMRNAAELTAWYLQGQRKRN